MVGAASLLERSIAEATTYSDNVTVFRMGAQPLTLTGVGLDTTTALAAPGTVTPTGSATGGTLAAATYYYKVTALDAFGETTASPEASVTTTGTTSSVGLAWVAVTGATSYKVYRGTTAGGESTFYTTVTNSFTDTGAAGTAGTVPTANTTAGATPGFTVSFNGDVSSTSSTDYQVWYKSGVLAVWNTGTLVYSNQANAAVDTGDISINCWCGRCPPRLSLPGRSVRCQAACQRAPVQIAMSFSPGPSSCGPSSWLRMST